MKPFVYVKAPATAPLKSLAEAFRSLFPGVAVEERYSDNYHRGYYYRAELDGRRTTLCYADEETDGEYLFWIAVGGEDNAAHALLVDQIARGIAARGFATFLPTEHIDDLSHGVTFEPKA